jgi:hypothetical protein
MSAMHASMERETGSPFVVVAMFTPSHRGKAERLESSLLPLGLSYRLYEVPQVHCSTSPAGGADLGLTKPAFIAAALDAVGRPVLYVDADMVFRGGPAELQRLVREGVDFAAYNWLADSCTDGYKPVPGNDRLYRFAISVDGYDPGQLICAGNVLFWNDSPGAKYLLALWRDTIEKWPRAATDESPDYAYNFQRDMRPARVAWLGKENLRCPWWIHVKPVIAHPDAFTSASGWSFSEVTGMARFRPCRTLVAHPPFPRDCMIDVKRKLLFRGNRQIGSFSFPLYLG